jgi:hypothetical protein
VRLPPLSRGDVVTLQGNLENKAPAKVTTNTVVGVRTVCGLLLDICDKLTGFEPMTEIEILQKQLVTANAEIQTLTMRLRNAEILYERELRKNDVKEAAETRSQGR